VSEFNNSNKNAQSTEAQEKSSRGGSRQHRSTNPLGSSPLMSPPASPPTLPTFPPASSGASSSAPSMPQLPVAPAASIGSDDQQIPLLYNTPPAPDYILRPFEQKHDRQTIYLDARKAGAIDALVSLVAKGNKTNLVEEMVDDLIAKYAQLLQENAELVRILEDKYRKKHRL
jgi:hypothetical protein